MSRRKPPAKPKPPAPPAPPLERGRSISALEATEDLRRTFIRHPMFQAKNRFSASEAAGATELGWYRGHQAGVFDSYLTLRDAFPDAARALLEAHSMDEDGTIG